LADPRTVSGFNPLYKDLVYPLVTNKSRGSRIWDLDGNEYVDYVCGFGPILFGHSPDFIADAVREQLSMGIETGPQSVLAGEVAELVLELTGHERCAFASTGSEAVLGAIRLARTVTGRNKVVVFEGAYHGIVDEVLYRKGRDGRALPGAPGIPREALANLVVLPWNDMGVIEAVRTIGQDLAAVLVEPVQSRLPAVQPKELLQALRRVCDETGAALIMDEMITGFRMHPGGAQSVFGVSGDLATYGKIVGGGFPLGIIAGTRRFMDALDGGHWQYGDESLPTIGVTYFAGTFVRHPIALAAARATLNRLKTEGPDLQATLSRRTGDLVTDLAGFLASVEAQVEIHHCASWFEVTAGSNEQFMPLFFVLMRLRGFHVQDGRPFFLTTAHSDSDRAAFSEAFKMSVCELIVADLLSGDKLAANRTMRANDAVPPVPGARLGRDDDGNPAWYVEDASRPGEYTQVGPVQTFH
jgi:glutamate-1-semialdehyde aminotransferase